MSDTTSFAQDEIQKFLSASGQKGAKILSDLGRLIPFVEAIDTEVGKELIKDDVQRYVELRGKVLNLESTQDEEAEYRYLKDIRLPRVAGRLAEYNKKIAIVREAVK